MYVYLLPFENLSQCECLVRVNCSDASITDLILPHDETDQRDPSKPKTLTCCPTFSSSTKPTLESFYLNATFTRNLCKANIIVYIANFDMMVE